MISKGFFGKQGWISSTPQVVCRPSLSHARQVEAQMFRNPIVGRDQGEEAAAFLDEYFQAPQPTPF